MRGLYQTTLRLPHGQKDHKREQKTVLTLDTQTVESSQTTTYFRALWIGTVKTAKTTTNSCSTFSTTFGSCLMRFFYAKLTQNHVEGHRKTPCQVGAAQADSLLAPPALP